MNNTIVQWLTRVRMQQRRLVCFISSKFLKTSKTVESHISRGFSKILSDLLKHDMDIVNLNYE